MACLGQTQDGFRLVSHILPVSVLELQKGLGLDGNEETFRVVQTNGTHLVATTANFDEICADLVPADVCGVWVKN